MRRLAALILGRPTALRRAIALALAERGIDLIVAGCAPADPPAEDQETARRYGVAVSRLTIPPGATTIPARDFDAASRRHRGVDIVVVLDTGTVGDAGSRSADAPGRRARFDFDADRAATSLLALALPHMTWSRWGRVIRIVETPDPFRRPCLPDGGRRQVTCCGVMLVTIVAPAAARGRLADPPPARRGRAAPAFPAAGRGGSGTGCERVARLVIQLCSEPAGSRGHGMLHR